MLSTASRSAFAGALRPSVRIAAPLIAALACAMSASGQAVGKPFLPPPPATVSTVPSTGDVNPYGTAFVPNVPQQHSVLQYGDLLVSNYNNNNNLQGTGTSIVRIDGNGKQSLFFQSSSKYTGLSGALYVLNNGDVLVGNVPTLDGTPATLGTGALQIVSPSGSLLSVISNPAIIDGPWGMTKYEEGNSIAHVFVSNVLNGSIARLTFKENGNGSLTLTDSAVIATGLTHRTDPVAIVLGPTGLVYDGVHDILYMASSTDNAIYKFEHAMTVEAGQAAPVLVVQDLAHLHGPLDLAFAGNGDLLAANSDGSNVDPNQPSEIVEYTEDGAFVAQYSVDPNNGGAFGIATQQRADAVRFAAVDDNTSTVTISARFAQ